MRKLPIIEVREGDQLTLQDGATHFDVPMEQVDSDHVPQPGELAVQCADRRWTVGDAPAKNRDAQGHRLGQGRERRRARLMPRPPDDTSVNGSIDPETDEDGPPWDPDGDLPDEAEIDDEDDEPALDVS